MVRFAIQWEQVSGLDPGLFAVALDFEQLSTVIKGSRGVKSFLVILREEVHRVSDVFSGRVHDLVTQADTMLKRTTSLSAKAIDSLVTVAITLEKFFLLNKNGIQKIVKKCEKHLKISVPPWEDLGAEFLRLGTAHHGKLLLLISRLYEKAKGKGGPGVWVPPESFSRSTTKYLIPEHRAFELSLRLSKIVPVLCFDPTAVEATQLVSSVYYDSPDMNMYEHRLAREEGAQLLRVRWYNQLTKESQTFVERKTHHEGWVAEESVKERFAVPSTHIHRYLYNEWDPAAYLEATTTDPRALAHSNELAAEILELVEENDLRPACRTVYERVAFQETSNNNVRISLDWQLRMVKEDIDRPRYWANVPEECAPGDIFYVPYAVLEVKLQGDPPPGLDPIIEDMEPVRYKFSKYLTGCALHFPERVAKLPEWWDDPALAQAMVDHHYKTTLELARQAAAEGNIPQGTARPRLPLPESSRNVNDDATLDTVNYDNEHDALVRNAGGLNNDSALATFPPRASPKVYLSPRHQLATDAARKTRRTLVRVEPKTIFGNERTWLGWLHQVMLILAFAAVVLSIHPMKIWKLFNVVGSVMIWIGAFVSLYCCWRYYSRVDALKKAKPIGYADIFAAPTLAIFTVGSVFVLIVSVAMAGDTVKGDPFRPDTSTYGTINHKSSLLGASSIQKGQVLDAFFDEHRGVLLELAPNMVTIRNMTTMSPIDVTPLPQPASCFANAGNVVLTDGQLFTLKGAKKSLWSHVDLPAEGPPIVAMGGERMVLSLPTGDVVVYPPPPQKPYFMITGTGPMRLTSVGTRALPYGTQERWFVPGHPGQLCAGHLGGEDGSSHVCEDIPSQCSGASVARFMPSTMKYLCVVNNEVIIA